MAASSPTGTGNHNPFRCGCCGGLSRRGFLAGAGALGAAAMVPGATLAQAAAHTLIDTHHHYYPPSYLKAWLAFDDAHKLPHFPGHLAWSRDKAVDEMAQNGITTALLSLASTPGLWFNAGVPDIIGIVRAATDFGAEMMRDFPGKFGLLAPLTMIDVDATMKEIDYAFGTLKADGVGLQTSYGSKWLGDPAFAPIFEELNRRKAVVYVHPVAGACCTNLSVGLNPATLEVPFDTTRAIGSLLVNGTLARTRDIRWLFSHAGGALPMLAGRIDAFYAHHPKRPEFAPDGIEAELRRLYYDTANAAFPPTLAALAAFVPTTQITYGTDYPYFRLDQINSVRQAKFSQADLAAIESGNAIRLVPRLGA